MTALTILVTASAIILVTFYDTDTTTQALPDDWPGRSIE